MFKKKKMLDYHNWRFESVAFKGENNYFYYHSSEVEEYQK